jgi:hypothetical protein
MGIFVKRCGIGPESLKMRRTGKVKEVCAPAVKGWPGQRVKPLTAGGQPCYQTVFLIWPFAG